MYHECEGLRQKGQIAEKDHINELARIKSVWWWANNPGQFGWDDFDYVVGWTKQRDLKFCPECGEDLRGRIGY